jgi:hypothetical protein
MGHYIVPIVGLVCGQNEQLENTHELIDNLKPNPDEVHSVFSIPLSYFSLNLNSDKVFHLMHEPFGPLLDSIKLKLIREFQQNDCKPTDFYRLFINLNKTVFQSTVDTYPYLYGFNAFMILEIVLLVNCDLKFFSDTITLSSSNIITLTDNIRRCSYLLYLKELHKKSKL